MRRIYDFVFQGCGSGSVGRGQSDLFRRRNGHPYFSTDTGAVLRAIEIEADAMLLAKQSTNFYDSDPK